MARVVAMQPRCCGAVHCGAGAETRGGTERLRSARRSCSQLDLFRLNSFPYEGTSLALRLFLLLKTTHEESFSRWLRFLFLRQRILRSDARGDTSAPSPSPHPYLQMMQSLQNSSPAPQLSLSLFVITLNCASLFISFL